MMNQTYLGWHDARKKQTLERRVTDATRRFTDKHGYEPAVAIVNPDDLTNPGQARFDLPTLTPAPWVPRGTVYFGPITDSVLG